MRRNVSYMYLPPAVWPYALDAHACILDNNINIQSVTLVRVQTIYTADIKIINNLCRIVFNIIIMIVK